MVLAASSKSDCGVPPKAAHSINSWISPLYPRIRRDAVILQQLAAGKSLYECNDRLAACGEVMIG